MKKKILKFITVAVASAFVLSATKVGVYAADNYHTLQDSPEYDNEVKIVFSVAKGEVVDVTTNGTQYDGRPYGDYDQIHENVNGHGNNGRYTINNVSGGAVGAYLGEGVKNINETLLNKGNDGLVEEALRNLIDYDTANTIAMNYIAANRGLDAESFWIDWYVFKYQQDGYNPNANNYGRIHVDGKVINIIIEEEPTPEITPQEEEEEPTPEITPPEEEKEPEVTPIEKPTPIITYIPTYYEDPTPEITPTEQPTPEVTPTEQPTPEVTPTQEIIEEIVPSETPQSAPEEEIIDDDLIPSETPQGAPEEDPVEEEIEVEPEKTPQGLPQTGTTENAVFYSFGFTLIAIGVLIVRKNKRPLI